MFLVNTAEKLAEEALKAANAEKALEQEVIENPGEETPPDLGL